MKLGYTGLKVVKSVAKRFSSRIKRGAEFKIVTVPKFDEQSLLHRGGPHVVIIKGGERYLVRPRREPALRELRPVAQDPVDGR